MAGTTQIFGLSIKETAPVSSVSTTDIVEQCGTCKYSFVLPNGNRCCRRFPPAPQPPDSQSGLAFTKEDWWCGEYKKAT